MNNLAILTSWYQRVWVEADLDAVDEMFVSDPVASGLMDFNIGPEDFKALVPAFRALVKNITFSIDNSVETADWIWVHVTIHCNATSSLAPVTINGQTMARIVDGKIVEAFNHFDFLSFFEQLGQFPRNTMGLLLAGESLT